MAIPCGCLLVGSVPLKDAETVLTTCADALPGRLAAIPDGETGKRIQYTQFQIPLFPQKSLAFDGKIPLSDEEVASLTKELEQSTFETGYDTAAFESYEIFKRLRKEGKIAKETKFQVGIPTIGNVVGAFIKPELQKTAETLYEKGLFESLSRLQAGIAHEDLVIQIDMGMDLSYWEDLGKTGDYWSWVPWSAWFEDRSYVVEYLSRLINQVDPDVDLGLHYCYGDINHKHFSQPESLASIVDLHVQLMTKIQRGPAAYIHCPVPLSAMDKLDSFYAPLKALTISLEKDSTKLYLGLVHANDLEGTKQRIEAALAVVDNFGIATECGLGRTAAEDITGILDIMREVSQTI